MRSIINALPSLLLLFFIFLSNQAQGIRLENWMMKQVVQLEKALIEKESLVVEEGCKKLNLCVNGHAKYSANNRKLLTATSSPFSSPTSRNNEEEGNKKGNSKADNSDQNVETVLIQHYPNLIDITEMDYSPATRKTPIHN